MSSAQYQPVSNGQSEGSSPPPPAYSSPHVSKDAFPPAESKLGMPKAEEQSSRAAVTASVLFYLVAALVVRVFILPLPRKSADELE